jgi:hypothetical protein
VSAKDWVTYLGYEEEGVGLIPPMPQMVRMNSRKQVNTMWLRDALPLRMDWYVCPGGRDSRVW